MVREKEIMDFRFPLDARHPAHSKVEITIMLYVHLSTVCMNKYVHILVINFWQIAAELLECVLRVSVRSADGFCEKTHEFTCRPRVEADELQGGGNRNI